MTKKPAQSIRVPLPSTEVIEAIHDHARNQGYRSAAAYIRALIAKDMSTRRKEVNLSMSWGKTKSEEADDDGK